MSIQSVKQGIRQAVQSQSDQGTTISKSEAEAIVRDAALKGFSAGERAAIQKALDSFDVSQEAKAVFADALSGQTGGTQNLGLVDPPGSMLGGKTFSVKPGDSLTFEYYGNQIQNTFIK